MRERLLAEQRLGVARAQQDQVAPRHADHFLDRSSTRPRMADISAPPRVTSVDVARRAGVSQSTVSLVLSGKARGRISARTEEAVRAAAAELGYRPNVAARALRTGVARSVALVVPDITNPFFGRVLRGAQRAAQEAGYTVVLVDIGNNRAWEAASVAGAARRPRRRPAALRGRPPARHDRARDPDRDVPGGGLPVVRLDVEAGVDSRSTTCSSSATRKIGHVALELRGAHLRPAPRPHGRSPRRRTPPTVEAPFTFEGAKAAARAAARRRTSPPSSATTTSSPAASTWPPASAASRSRTTCPSSASTTSTSRACSRRR